MDFIILISENKVTEGLKFKTNEDKILQILPDNRTKVGDHYPKDILQQRVEW